MAQPKATSLVPLCPPRFGTPRNHDRPTLGPHVARLAAALGKPLMPWQRLVADVALEVLPDGRLAYDEAGVTVQRQAGKTTLLLPVIAHRGVAELPGGRLDVGPQPQTTVYTAQTRNDARKKWIKEFTPRLSKSPLRARFDVRLTNGSEGYDWVNGSTFDLMATMEKSGHGDVVDLGLLDEIFAQQDDRLEQAITPAMNTRMMALLIWASTAGESPAKSPYMWGKVEAGREMIEAGEASRVAYFEWSVPDDEDGTDPDVCARYHPAVGYTIDVEVIRAARYKMRRNLAGFQRAYANQWGTGLTAGVIPMTDWDECEDMRAAPSDPLALALDVEPSRGRASVLAAGPMTFEVDGEPTVLPVIDLIDDRPGVEWVVPRLAELSVRWGFEEVTIEGRSAAEALVEPLEQAGFRVRRCASRDMVQATGRFYDLVVGHGIRHLGDDVLRDAIAAAVKRDVGDASWVLGRRNSAVCIAPAIGALMALWAHENPTVPPKTKAEPDFIVV